MNLIQYIHMDKSNLQDLLLNIFLFYFLLQKTTWHLTFIKKNIKHNRKFWSYTHCFFLLTFASLFPPSYQSIGFIISFTFYNGSILAFYNLKETFFRVLTFFIITLVITFISRGDFQNNKGRDTTTGFGSHSNW